MPALAFPCATSSERRQQHTDYSTVPSAVAQGLQAQLRILGGNIGLAVATIILNARLNADLSGVLTPEQLSGLKRSLKTLSLLNPSEKAAVGASFANSFRYQILVCLGVACLGLCSCALIWQRHPRTFQDLKRNGG